MQALGVVDAVGALDQGEVGDGRHEVLADALHQPAAGLAELASLHVVGQHRARRVGQDHLDLRRHLLEEMGQAAEGAARADADHHRIHALLHLPPDFRAGAALVGPGIGRVVELVDVEGARRLFGDAARQVLVIVGVALADIGAGQAHLGAERLEVEDLLATHLVRHHQQHVVALLRGHQGQAQAGVAGGGFDDGAAGLQLAAGFGGLDHGQGDAVLDRAAGVLVFQLDEQLARASVEVGQRQDRRVADHVEQGIGGHRLGPPRPGRSHCPVRITP